MRWKGPKFFKRQAAGTVNNIASCLRPSLGNKLYSILDDWHPGLLTSSYLIFWGFPANICPKYSTSNKIHSNNEYWEIYQFSSRAIMATPQLLQF